MQVIQTFSAKDGEAFVNEHHPNEVLEIYATIHGVDATPCLRKVSAEKTMIDALLYAPDALNAAIKGVLHPNGWGEAKATGKRRFREPRLPFDNGRFREMDGLKNRVGLEVQFGKYAFMGYDIFSKMIIFRNKGLIDCGIEIVASASLVNRMSTGVSEFDQIVVDFKNRGEADIDLPVLVLGIGLTPDEVVSGQEKVDRFLLDPEALYASGEVDRPKAGARPGPK